MKKKLLIFLIIILASVLRFWNIGTIPALNADEAALGYNAFSLIQTGKDEFGTSWPLVFRSFDDYKPGIYVYLDIPFIMLLGLNVFAVRLPGILLSIVSIYLLYKLIQQIFKNHPQANAIALTAALILAISPWHIHFSRGAWETQVSTTFLLAAVLTFYQGITHPRIRYLSVIFFALALYTYHSMRVVVPLLGSGLLIINWKSYITRHLKSTILSGLLFILVLVPFILQLFSPIGIARAKGVGLTADTGPLWRANELRSYHQDMNTPVVRILHNQWVQYGLTFLSNYTSHFSMDFLFLSGDIIQRNRVPLFGQLLLVSLPFLIIGFVYLLRDLKTYAPVIIWLLIAPIPAALTFQSPHAVRAFSMIIPIAIITAVGIIQILSRIPWPRIKYAIILITIMVFAWDTSRYMFNYHKLMVYWYPYSSQYGVQELVSYISSVQDQYDQIWVTDRYDQPYILFLFYLAYPPEQFQQQATVEPASHGFGTVRQFDHFIFASPDWEKIAKTTGKKLIITAPEETPRNTQLIHTITLPGYKDKIIFNISQLNV